MHKSFVVAFQAHAILLLALSAACASRPRPSPDCILPPGVSDTNRSSRDVTFILLSGELVADACAPFRVAATAPIDYPVNARKARMQGTVVIIGLVSESGCVEAAYVQRGLNPLLDHAALRGIRQWSFTPTGHPIITRWFRTTVKFVLT